MLLVVAVALAAPLLYPESPWMMVAEPLIKPFADPAYPFGTDMLGRDITAGLVWGARVSLLVGLLSTGVALVFGILVGAVAGYCGGRIADALMRFTEFFQTKHGRASCRERGCQYVLNCVGAVSLKKKEQINLHKY